MVNLNSGFNCISSNKINPECYATEHDVYHPLYMYPFNINAFKRSPMGLTVTLGSEHA